MSLEETGPRLILKGSWGREPTERVCFPGYGVVCKGLKVQQEEDEVVQERPEIGEDRGQSWQGLLVNLRRAKGVTPGF